MEYDPKIHHRRSIRLKGYDYSEPGMYHVTICERDRRCVFGEVVNDEVRPSEIGEIVKRCWEEIPQHFSNATLDKYVMMPNHMHGIVFLKDKLVGARHEKDARDLVGVEYIQPPRAKRRSEFQHITPKSLGSIIRSFKAAVSRICRKGGYPDFAWQRDFYAHIIRDGEDLDRIREYSIDNPTNWTIDEDFPKNIRMDLLHRGKSDFSPFD